MQILELSSLDFALQTSAHKTTPRDLGYVPVVWCMQVTHNFTPVGFRLELLCFFLVSQFYSLFDVWFDVQLSQELEVKPFSSLSMHLKSESMAWLCDELNTSQAVTGEIENNLESVLNLRRDKWELEGKIRE